MSKNHGPITNIQGFNEKLLIHLRDALYATIGNTQLQAENLSVSLGSGDIFRIEPEQPQPDTHGLGGLQHKFAALLTPAGYVFYDATAKTPYLYNDKLVNMSNQLMEFFQSLPIIMKDHPIRGAGYLMGYDPRLRRIMLGMYFEEQYQLQPFSGASDIPNLEVNDVVTLYGKPFRFIGLNTTEFECVTPPPCPVPVISGLATPVSVASNVALIDAFTTDVEATSGIVTPSSVASLVKTGALTWELRRVTAVAGVYNLSVVLTNACGNSAAYPVVLTVTEAVAPCISPAVQGVVPSTIINMLAGNATPQLIATIEMNQPGLTVTDDSANLTTSQSGVFVSVYATAMQVVGSYSATVTLTNACGSTTVVFTVNVLADLTPSEGHQVFMSASGDPSCFDTTISPTDIVYTLPEVVALAAGNIIYTSPDASAIWNRTAAIIDASNGNLFSVNLSTGQLTLITICPY
jgi:hypothetical protein